MKVLAIDPMGVEGHLRFNSGVVRALEMFADVTLLAPSFHVSRMNLSRSVRAISLSPRRVERAGRLRPRIEQIRRFGRIHGIVKAEQPDVVLFLAYDILTSWLLKTRAPTFVIDHNTLDQANTSSVKRFIWQRATRRLHHLVFNATMREFLLSHGICSAHVIPFPHCLEFVAGGDACEPPDANGDDRLAVFAPSSSGAEATADALLQWAEHDSSIQVAAKSRDERVGENYYFSKFFHDYDQRLRGADVVVFGGKFDYRVSNVVYEALSLGKHTVLLRSGFASELAVECPQQVTVVDSLHELRGRVSGSQYDHRLSQGFITAHGLSRLSEELCYLFSNFIKTTRGDAADRASLATNDANRLVA